MKIKFEIDVQGKRITFYIKRGELQDWVADAVKKFPELSTGALCKNGSEFLSKVMIRTTKEVCEKNGVMDWDKLKPDFVTYKDKSELPLPLRVGAYGTGYIE
jgi:hypothetical protein